MYGLRNLIPQLAVAACALFGTFSDASPINHKRTSGYQNVVYFTDWYVMRIKTAETRSDVIRKGHLWPQLPASELARF